MVRLLPSTARVALVGNEGLRHCERTKSVNEGIEGAILIQNKVGSQKFEGKGGDGESTFGLHPFPLKDGSL